MGSHAGVSVSSRDISWIYTPSNHTVSNHHLLLSLSPPPSPIPKFPPINQTQCHLSNHTLQFFPPAFEAEPNRTGPDRTSAKEEKGVCRREWVVSF